VKHFDDETTINQDIKRGRKKRNRTTKRRQ